MQSNTKRVNLTPAFMRAAETDKVGALAYMLMAAFGVSLTELTTIALDIIDNKNTELCMMSLAAAVQIRGNVVFVGSEFANIRAKYPILIIEGDRAQQDVFNFSALHCLGHILCTFSSEKLAQKILQKAGNAITGANVTASIAGAINKQIAESWPIDEVAEFNAVATKISDKRRAVINSVLAGASTRSTAFSKSVSASTSSVSSITIGTTGKDTPSSTSISY